MRAMIAGKWEQLNAHPRTRDAVVAGVWLLIGLAALQLAGIRLWNDFALFYTDGTVYLIALFAISAVALLRSTRPFLVLGLGASIAAVDLAFGGSLGVVLVLSDLVYAAVKYGSDRGLRIGLWAALVAAVLLAIALLVVSPHSSTVPTVAVQFALIIFVSAAWGWAVRSERSRTRVAMMQAHAQQTSEMRERIAHDLHDLVANHIAVAGLHVEAAKLRVVRDTAAPDPDRPAGQGATQGSALGSAIVASLERAKQGTDAAHRELRALIEVLTATIDLDNAGRDALEHGSDAGRSRFGDGGMRPPAVSQEIAADLESLGSLLPEGRELRWHAGSFERATSRLAASSAATQTSALRVLRELVANAAKHGVGDIEFSITEAPAGARFTISNDTESGGPIVQGTQLGLRSAGMMLSLAGGQLESGPSASGDAAHQNTWVATMTLPGQTSETNPGFEIHSSTANAGGHA